MLAQNVGGLFCSCFGGIIWLAVVVAVIAGFWKTFEKAGHPGWAAIIPFYNLYILTQIAGREILWFVLMFIPIVNIVAAVLVCIDVAKRFGKTELFGVGLALLSPVFFCILGFSDARYSAQVPPGSKGGGIPPVRH